MRCEEIRADLVDYVDGQIDEESLPLLESHLERCSDCSAEAAEIRQTWSMLGELKEARSTAGMKSRFEAELSRQAGATQPAASPGSWLASLWPKRPALQAGFAVAMLIVGVLLAPRLGYDSGGHREIQALRAEMEAMNRAVALSLLEHQSASERLHAVSLAQNTRRDDGLTRALLEVVDSDPSVNVRLAALDVLSRMVQHPEVRTGLLQSFGRQQSPTMTVAMADVLLAMKGEESRLEVRQASENQSLPDPVREYLREALIKGKEGT